MRPWSLRVSLLQEIQAAVIDEKTSVTTLLLKCQLLAARISHGELARWVELELNGYPEGNELPDYRKQGRGRALGTFSGPFGSGGKNVPLSMGVVEEEHREVLFNIDLRQPAAALEDLAVNRPGGSELGIPWPGDFIGYYGKPGTFVENMALVAATTFVPRQAIVAALSAIRSRVLKLATEIERAAPDAGEGLAGSDPLPREVSTAVTQNIYGGSIAVGTGPAFALAGPLGQLVVGNATNVTLIHAIDRLGEELEAADVPEEEKARIRQWLGQARAALADAGGSVAAKFLAELVARGLH